MAIDTAKTLIEVKADTTQAQKSLRDLANETAKASGELKKQAEQSGLLGKKWEELSKSMVGLQMHDAVKKLSDRLGEATGGVLDLNAAFAGAQVAGPWGAAIGLVGGAVAKTANLMDNLGVSLDELEEKAQKHARTFLPELTGEFWKEHDAIKAMNDRLLDTPYRLAKVFESFQTLYPLLKKVREEIQTYDSAPARLNRGLKAGAAGLQNLIGDAVNRYLGVSGWNPLKYDKAGGSDNSPEWSWESSLGSRGRFDLGPGRPAYSVTDPMFGGRDAGALAGMQADTLNTGDVGRFFRNAGMSALHEQGQAKSLSESKKRESYLESAFGKIEEFDLYATGFKTLGAAIDVTTGAVGASLSAWIDGSKSAGAAFKSFIAEALKGLAVQMTVEALKHGAYALASLAFGSPATAALHAKAAAAFAVGAAITIPLAKSLGGSGGPSASAGGGSAPNVTGSGGPGTRDPERIIVYGDPFADDSPRGKQLQARKMVDRAYGNSAVSHS